MGGVCTAQVRTWTRAEVRIVPFRLMDPPPSQILTEINIEWSHTALLLIIAADRRRQRGLHTLFSQITHNFKSCIHFTLCDLIAIERGLEIPLKGVPLFSLLESAQVSCQSDRGNPELWSRRVRGGSVC